MQNAPVSPRQHGLNDYGFTTLQWITPSLLRLNPAAKKLYAGLGANLLLYNALTNHGAGAAPVVPYKTHKWIDIANVAGLALLALHPAVRRQKKALVFHAAFTALAALHIYLTNWKEKP